MGLSPLLQDVVLLVLEGATGSGTASRGQTVGTSWGGRPVGLQAAEGTERGQKEE